MFKFQSTLPVWGATIAGLITKNLVTISIHAPRVGSDYEDEKVEGFAAISIHAPRVGSDHR